jgi:hypothetical protein
MLYRCLYCYRTYDSSQCKDVNTQYRDVTIWITPCCGTRVDDEYYNGALTAGRGRKHYEEVSLTDSLTVEDQMREMYMGIPLVTHIGRRRRW